MGVGSSENAQLNISLREWTKVVHQTRTNKYYLAATLKWVKEDTSRNISTLSDFYMSFVDENDVQVCWNGIRFRKYLKICMMLTSKRSVKLRRNYKDHGSVNSRFSQVQRMEWLILEVTFSWYDLSRHESGCGMTGNADVKLIGLQSARIDDAVGDMFVRDYKC